MVGIVLAGCTSGVAVTAPTPDPTAARICRDLADRLPSTVGGQARRPTSPLDATTAAWGDPPIVLRCGVPRPAALTATSQLVTVDGVDWFPEQLTAGTLFTTYGRSAYVEVTVPQAYAPEAGPLGDLTTAVRGADPTT